MHRDPYRCLNVRWVAMVSVARKIVEVLSSAIAKKSVSIGMFKDGFCLHSL